VSFAAPWFLLGLLAVPVLLWAYWARERQRAAAGAAFVSAPLRPSVVRWRPGWRRHLPIGLAALALTVLLFALSRPERTVAVPAEQARIVLTTDTSGSMQATDVEPSRLAAVKKAAADFLDKVPRKVRVGAVVFDHRAQLAQTPTLDRGLVREVVDNITPHGGTATGDALEVSINALKARPNERRPPGAIVLLSDGKATSGIDPVQMAQEARKLKIPIYTVALGTESGTIIVPRDGGGVEERPVPPDPESLAEIADVSGGKTFTADTATGLSEVYEKLGSQLSHRNEKRQITSAFAGGGLVLLLAGAVMSLGWFGRPI
jgi:Ca-activated chloride channel family protein